MKVDLLIQEYQEVFDGQPWYGVSVMETLRSISHEEANTRWDATGHSIGELVKHMLVWRIFVIEKLKENDKFDIGHNGVLDWEVNLVINDEDEWSGIIEEFASSQVQLISALSAKGEEWLNQITPGRDYHNEHLLRGIIQHDVYHLGQIRLIRASMLNDNPQIK